jgi:GalNAc-alpha-(1->4)-GalNAc-alpha-(1->3)-diNAcBac-PP-undecaprenol alpha-1,4-N-acetyl-D-galactosaminyltransferase
VQRGRLCLVIHSLQVGGMERVMSELAGYFCQKKDLEVHLILCGRKPEIFYYVPDNLIIHRPNLEFNNRFRHISTLRRLLFLRRTVVSINPDSVLSFGEFWNSFVLLAVYGLPYPVFISDRCSPMRNFSTFHNLLRKFLYPKAKGVIAQTEKAKQLYVSQFKHNNVCVIGNPIRRINGNNLKIERENIVLSVGRLIESKHFDKLIELFADISNPDWKLVIVGDDALKQKTSVKLKELVHSLNAEENIILVGKQTHVDSYFLCSKIFVMTSSSEGFPNVIGEAMSAGLPVVAFDCIAGPSELIDDGENGFLIPLFDFVEMKRKIIMLMQNGDLRLKLGMNAQKSMRDFFPIEIGEKYYSFIMM